MHVVCVCPQPASQPACACKVISPSPSSACSVYPQCVCAPPPPPPPLSPVPVVPPPPPPPRPSQSDLYTVGRGLLSAFVRYHARSPVHVCLCLFQVFVGTCSGKKNSDGLRSRRRKEREKHPPPRSVCVLTRRRCCPHTEKSFFHSVAELTCVASFLLTTRVQPGGVQRSVIFGDASLV